MLLTPPVPVALARRARTIPPGDLWASELKMDGWRCLIFRTYDVVHLQTRAGRLIEDRFPDLAEAAARQLPEGVVLDGELVIWHHDRIDFAAVQKRALSHPRRATALARELPASYTAFDILEADATDWRPRPYRERRTRLLQLLAEARPPLQIMPATSDRGLAADWWERWHPDVGIEGLVVKHLDAPYRAGTRDWLKLKHWDARGR